MTRVLPGVYGSIFDNSQLPEGQGVLTVGYTLACNKGTVGEPFLVTSPTDFLEKTTLSGKPPINGDPTFTTILNVLQQTNQVYISRVAQNPLYGGLVVKRDYLLGDVAKIEDTSTYQEGTGTLLVCQSKITLQGVAQSAVNAGDTVRLYDTDNLDGRYLVQDVEVVDGNTVVTVESCLTDTLVPTGTLVELYKTQQPKPITEEVIGEVVGIDNNITLNKQPYTELVLNGNCSAFALQGDLIQLVSSDVTDKNNGLYIVYDCVYNTTTNETTITVEGKLDHDFTETTGVTIQLYRNSIANPENYGFKEDDLFLIYGKDQGAYNGNIAVNIVSSLESPDQLGEPGTMEITAFNAQSGVQLGNTFVCSRSETAYSIAGEPLWLEQVINGNSEYIMVKNNNNADEDLLPCDTVTPVTVTFTDDDYIENTGGIVIGYNVSDDTDGIIGGYTTKNGQINGYISGYAPSNARLGGGSDGTPINKTVSEPFISALEVFKDKTVPVSILGNGWCENSDYQQALLSVAEGRLDCFAFLNSRLTDEQAQSGSTRAQNIVKYKKQDLGSTTYMATMYAPHVTAVDTLNQRKVLVGAEAVAIPGWLGIINTKGYPYAYAGYDDGAVTGVTTKWKIGDQSGEAQVLNDASINYIAYDAKDGVYYMQAQNTLQIANSALRNVGTVLNILDIKETFMRYFKPFIQKPITSELRGLILDGGRQQVSLYIAQDRITDGVLQDVSTDFDISNNTLRYLLTIAPTPYAQVIYLVMNIVNQTYDFSILQSA